MPQQNRFFVIRSDGTTLTASADELLQLRKEGKIRAADTVIPVATTEQAAKIDQDTAPIDIPTSIPQPAETLLNLGDLEIEQALNSLTSESWYQLQAKSQEQTKSQAESYFHIKFTNGQVIGEFSQASILDQIKRRRLSGREQVAENGGENFRPLRDYAVFGMAIKIHIDSQNPPPDAKRLDSLGLIAVLFNLAQQVQSGWLTVVNGPHTKVLAIGVGRIKNIGSNETDLSVEQELTELFSWEQGEYWFDNDPVAAGAENIISQNTLQLSRQLTSGANSLSLRRLIQFVGDQNRLVQVAPPSQLVFHDSDLTSEEKLLLDLAKTPKTIVDLVREAVANKITESHALHALLMLKMAGFVSFVQKPAAPVEILQTPIAPTPTAQVQKKPIVTSPLTALWACCLSAVVIGLLWVVSIDIGYGDSEIAGDRFDLFLIARFLILLAFAWLGFRVINHGGIAVLLGRLFKPISGLWVVVAILSGLLFGGLLDELTLAPRNLTAPSIIAVLMAVFSERLFFNAFFLEDVREALKNRWVALVLTSLVYGVYLLSYAELFHTPLVALPIRMVLLFIGLSFFTSAVHVLAKSAFASILFHIAFLLAAQLVMASGNAGWFMGLWS